MNTVKILICIFIFTNYVTWGQESSQYTIIMGQKYATNLAYAGLESTLSITGGYRAQWEELPGSPNSRIIHAHLPLYSLRGAGGFKLEQESFGIENNIRASVSYNYVYQSPIGVFSAGVGVGFISKTLDGSLLKTPSGRYEGTLIFHQDPALFETSLSGIAPQFSAGVYFAQDRLELGLAAENFHSPTIRFNHGKATYKIQPRINISGEYKIDLAESVTLTPSILLKTDIKNLQSDVAAMLGFNEKIFAGLGFRGYSKSTFDAISVLGGLKVSENLKIFYGLDLTVSSIKNAQQGTHELLINYNLNKKIGTLEREPIIFNPRY